MDRRPYEEMPEDVRKALEERRDEKEESISVLSFLESRHTMEIIMYLDERSPVIKSEIYSDVTRSPGTSEKIDKLRELGILEIYGDKSSNQKIIAITPKGRVVASKIRKMVEIIDGEEE